MISKNIRLSFEGFRKLDNKDNIVNGDANNK